MTTSVSKHGSRGAGSGNWLGVAIPVAVFVYVFSIGPVGGVLYRLDYRVPRRVMAGVEFLYAPVGWLAERFPPFERAMERYEQLWLPAETP